jgi:hypothetical protein
MILSVLHPPCQRAAPANRDSRRARNQSKLHLAHGTTRERGPRQSPQLASLEENTCEPSYSSIPPLRLSRSRFQLCRKLQRKPAHRPPRFRPRRLPRTLPTLHLRAPLPLPAPHPLLLPVLHRLPLPHPVPRPQPLLHPHPHPLLLPLHLPPSPASRFPE